MGWILGLDTSGTWCGVALARDGRVAGEERVLEPGANRALMPAVDRLCREAGITPRQLDGVAVAIGPGSFTGLRIGLAAAKGLALALDVPVAGVDSLEAAAATVAGIAGAAGPGPDAARAAPGAPLQPAGPLLVARRARRNEVYAAVYELPPAREDAGSGGAGLPPGSGAAAPRRLWGPEALPAAELLQRLSGIAPEPLGRWWWMAAGDTGLWEALAAGGEGAPPRRVEDPGPCPAAVCLLAAPRLAAGGDDPALLVPLYLPAVPGYRPYAGGPAG